MPNTALTQAALANDASFRQRVRSALSVAAWVVLNEDTGIVGHQQRAVYARAVIGNLDQATANLVGSLVMRTNVFAFATSVSIDTGVPVVTTTSGDPDLLAQLAADWTKLAGA